MIVIQYDAGDDPRMILAEALKLEPGRSFIVVPAWLVQLLGLNSQTEPTALVDRVTVDRAMSWRWRGVGRD